MSTRFLLLPFPFAGLYETGITDNMKIQAWDLILPMIYVILFVPMHCFLFFFPFLILHVMTTQSVQLELSLFRTWIPLR